MLLNAATVVAMILACSSTGKAMPTATEGDLAPRAYQSGTATCYSKCPDSIGGSPYQGGYDQQGEYYYDGQAFHVCYYYVGDFQAYAECDYDLNGVYIGSSAYDPNDRDARCGERAPTSGCGITPGSQDFKKRHVPRQLTKSEKVIRARQYQPKKEKRSFVN
ncbi:hypothetical protein CI109_103892 [Kwoniella shandongensis]|uniref:Uncharacterized protein n=1 Tax=Kwoniella shandongensis TaxID=1734106 RepID=A0A5M6BT57_9TREE|nr:uncharacterized protein CI109_005654 [Kwoniella shandongensis]KAA5526058.1 hypothetical protein CI109_005654 [Kwoniella shandongensis]